MSAGLLGCAALKPMPAPPPPPPATRGFALLPPSSAGFGATLTQEIGLVKGAKRFDALAVVEISSQTLTLAGLGPMGNRMMTLSWDGVVLTKELDPSIPGFLPFADILRNLQLAYWPEEALRRFLRPGWELKLEAGRRGLFYRGKEVIAVRYRGDPFKDPVEIEDNDDGYTTIIKTVDYSHE